MSASRGISLEMESANLKSAFTCVLLKRILNTLQLNTSGGFWKIVFVFKTAERPPLSSIFLEIILYRM